MTKRAVKWCKSYSGQATNVSFHFASLKTNISIAIMANIHVHQLLVAGSTLLASLAGGCSVSYPNVLLRQLSLNDSSIQLDRDTASWIGSIHGVAAIPSILMPAFMQWRGRKLAFILACLVSIIGWIIAFTATTATSILISECMHGFGSQSIFAVGMLSMSEMLSPQIRNVTMGLYAVMQALGMALAGIIGGYLHWRTVTLIVCAPLSLTALAACMWPESPSWLAYKGEFEKCAQAFTLLRGTGDLAQTELEELILAQKENLSRESKCKKQNLLKYFWQTLQSRDFYLPALHMFVALYSVYWIGALFIVIYSSDIIQSATHTKDAVIFGNTVLNIVTFLGCITSNVLIRYFQQKIVILISTSCGIAGSLSASGINYFQLIGLIPNESYISLYLLFWFMFFVNISAPMLMTLSAELMPVKHRGVGGPLFGIIACILHTTLMKSGPYMLSNLNLWGTLLVFAVSGILSHLFIWNYVPETKGRTLQQLEDYYAYGNIDKRRALDTKVGLQELMPIKE